MNRLITIKRLAKTLIAMFILLVASSAYAQKVVESGVQSAGFRFNTEASSVTPIVSFQQDIKMLSATGDMPTVKVYGSGRVLVHYPVYMKLAGDYEMQLDGAELVNLIRAMSDDGMMSFDRKKVAEKMQAAKKAERKKGELFAISDSVESIVDISLDEYQANKLSPKQKDFTKRFQWKDIEHDAKRYKDNVDIVKANQSVLRLQGLMKDSRLLKKEKQ